MSSILKDLSSASQGISPNESTQENTSKVNSTRITPLLWNRDETDLMLLKYVGEHDGVEINSLLPKVSVTYSALATRISKMTALGLLRRSKRTDVRRGPRPPYVYFLGTGVTLEAIEEVISSQGIDVKQFEFEQMRKRTRQANKRNEAEVVPDTDDTLKEDLWQSTQSGQEEERNGKVHQTWDSQKLQQSQLEQEQEDTDAEEVNYCVTSDSTSGGNTAEPLLHIAPNELSRTVTVGEVLEMVDEATDTLIETVTESFAELLNEKVIELNARIAELEQQLSKSQSSQSCQEPTEALLRRSRFLVRQKLLAKSSSMQNGNGKA